MAKLDVPQNRPGLDKRGPLIQKLNRNADGDTTVDPDLESLSVPPISGGLRAKALKLNRSESGTGHS